MNAVQTPLKSMKLTVELEMYQRLTTAEESEDDRRQIIMVYM